ncbi:MAG: protein kinase family protein [Chloroflexi bacterium]|nr:protein kinase family protein [Chloroflexota bacterium]
MSFIKMISNKNKTMIYPSRQDYTFAVTHLDKFVLDHRFKGGQPRRDNKNKIIGYTGGYSRVYPIQNGGKIIALRCWTANVDKAKERYTRIHSHLKTITLPYFVDFDFLDRGIIVNGTIFPILYMEWIEGITLNKFIDKNIQNPPLILQLATKFQKMVQELHVNKIAHGDLQEGNILVCTHNNNVTLKLIDYDSLYVPTLNGL